MVDRVYRQDLPLLRKRLLELRAQLARLDTRTDWVGLRVDPLLKHLKQLEALARSRRFSREFSRLRKGVPMFHSDLVYLRENVRGLQRVVESESDAGP